MANNKPEAARNVLVKYHGAGNPDSAVAALEFREMEEDIRIDIETSDKRWWDFRTLFRTRPMLYRVWLLMLVTTFSQFIGGSVIRYVPYTDW